MPEIMEIALIAIILLNSNIPIIFINNKIVVLLNSNIIANSFGAFSFSIAGIPSAKGKYIG